MFFTFLLFNDSHQMMNLLNHTTHRWCVLMCYDSIHFLQA